MIPTNPNEISTQNAFELTAPFSTTLTAKTIDYLKGNMLSKNGGNGIEYWTGPMATVGSPLYEEGMQALRRSFTPVNMTLEVCERRAEAVVGREPQWNFTVRRPLPDGTEPTPEERALITEAEAAITAWYDRLDLPSLLPGLTTVLVAHGRAPLRFFVDPRKLQRTEAGFALPKVRTLEEALRFLRVQFPNPNNPQGTFSPASKLDLTSTGVFTHPTTLQDIGVWYYKATSDTGDTRPELELTWLDEQDRTVLRRLRDEGPNVFSEAADPMDLWGYLWIHEWKTNECLVTDDLLRNQDALNVANTMLPRNTHFAGFLERYGIGIEPPGKWVPDPDKPGDLKFEPSRPTFGAGTLNFWQPSSFQETSTDANGNVTTSERPVQAQYGRFEPVAPAAITAAIQQAELNIYSLARQRYVLMSDDATASGRSREVAIGDHLTKAERLARTVEGGIRGILEFALAFASALTNQTERFKPLRASVQTRVVAFTPTPQEREQNRQDVAAGLMSAESAISKLTADVDAEKARILAELNTTPRVALEVLKQGGPTSVVLQGLLDAGVTAVTPEMVSQQRELDFAQVGQGIENPDAGMEGEGMV